ncbi:MAG: O-antigen ligase family protein [Granulosicoccus sp.]
MASTNPFPHAEKDLYNDRDDEVVGRDSKRRRGALGNVHRQRKASRASKRREREKASSSFENSGFPALDGLKPVLGFLAFPAFLVLALTVTGGGWPSYILYPIALALGLVVALSAFKGVELVLACMIIYLPFSKVFVVPLAPGVNGTNMLVLLGLFAALLRATQMRESLFKWPPGTVLVLVFGILSSLSAITVTFLPGGRTFLLYNELLSYKAWVDQFIFYFIALMCIRDTETAKRCFLYLLIGSMLVVLYAVPEMLEKMGRSTIEKSRIGGPHLQSNNFGGYIAYTVLPLIAIFIIYIKDLRAWLLTPYFLLTAKVLITTFSRGAYVAMLIGGCMAGWFKGKLFLFSWAAFALCFFLAFPNLLPDSISARMGSLTSDESSSASAEDRLDKSSSTRLIMWRAAAVMISEDPIWGKGFKGFPYLKKDYTEEFVEESDPHSMYLYIGSQMGLPALALFLLILGYSFSLGRTHSLNEDDRFIKAIGIGGAAATACFAVVCIFGSRAVSLNFTANFWILLVIMQVLKQQAKQEKTAAEEPRRKRTNAFEQRGANASGTSLSEIESERERDPAVIEQDSDSSYVLEGEFTHIDTKVSPSGKRGAGAEQADRIITTRSRAQKKPLRGAGAHQAALAAENRGNGSATEKPLSKTTSSLKRRGKK